jgi:hypothetical protein
MSAEHSRGTTLRPASWAIIWTPEDGWNWISPAGAPMPEEAEALLGVYLQLQDREFRERCARHARETKA